MSEPWVPTVDDLRTKMCYICREEERYDSPSEAKTAWTHPCNCTLIAHESCLLHWIQTSQQNPSRADKALKCPQCSATYEIQSENPWSLRMLDSINKKLGVVGKMITLASIGVTVASFGTCIYLLCTSYGAWAIREFLGQEMFNVLLTDDPANWPMHAFIHLPLIPLSLLASRSNLLRGTISPIYPFFLVWPSSIPVLFSRRMLVGQPGILDLPSLFSWPPAPVIAFFTYPLITGIYRRLITRFRHWVLETKPDEDESPRRFIWNLNEGRMNLAIHVEEVDAQIRQGQQPALGVNPEQENAADAAARTQNVNNGSVGRLIGGALIIPKVASLMGSLLFRISKHSYWLRQILAIRPPLRRELMAYGMRSPEDVTNFRQGFKFISSLFLGGTRTWHEADPVWWRNSLGLGIFVVMKDFLGLLHLYLAKRELQTRKVKSKSFAGIDVKELDLIHPPPHSNGVFF